MLKPPTDCPPADLTGRALDDWVRNVMPGSPTIAGRLAATHIHVQLAVREVTGDRKLALLAAERALRDHEAALRAGVDYPRPCLNVVAPDGEEVWEEHDPEAVERLLASLGFSPPPSGADVQAPG
jgi:hypothetical protein